MFWEVILPAPFGRGLNFVILTSTFFYIDDREKTNLITKWSHLSL